MRVFDRRPCLLAKTRRAIGHPRHDGEGWRATVEQRRQRGGFAARAVEGDEQRGRVRCRAGEIDGQIGRAVEPIRPERRGRAQVERQRSVKHVLKRREQAKARRVALARRDGNEPDDVSHRPKPFRQRRLHRAATPVGDGHIDAHGDIQG